MSTTIEWTQRPGTKGETWNPTTGCNKVSQGCKNCYAEVMHKRLRAMHQPKYQRHFSDGVVTHADTLTIPLGWKKPRTVFVNSMSDLFHADVPFAFIDQVFAIMALTPQHTYQILTKRPERMAEYLNTRDTDVYFHTFLPKEYLLARVGEDWETFIYEANYKHGNLPNVWVGTSVENQATANERIPHLLRTPAAVRFLSCEPLLGPVNLGQWLQRCPYTKHVDGRSHGLKWMGDDPYTECVWCGEVRSAPSGMVVGTKRTINDIHWVITGGESGPKARPVHPDWARTLRDQCQAAGVPFFFKQWGEWAAGTSYTMLDAGHEGELRRFYHYDRNTEITTYHAYPAAYPSGPAQVEVMSKVGKHASGNVLDGRTHQEYPATTSTPTT